eukprot:scaffold5143_cov119-Isochrysis_galbana.AAC.23
MAHGAFAARSRSQTASAAKYASGAPVRHVPPASPHSHVPRATQLTRDTNKRAPQLIAAAVWGSLSGQSRRRPHSSRVSPERIIP